MELKMLFLFPNGSLFYVLTSLTNQNNRESRFIKFPARINFNREIWSDVPNQSNFSFKVNLFFRRTPKLLRTLMFYLKLNQYFVSSSTCNLKYCLSFVIECHLKINANHQIDTPFCLLLLCSPYSDSITYTRDDDLA